MTKQEYAEKLKSPRWHKTRTRINSYAQGRRESCGGRTDSPQVHHEEYIGNHPSDTPDDLLKSLCPACHFETHWLVRIRAYGAEKMRLSKAGVWIDDKLHQELIKRFGV